MLTASEDSNRGIDNSMCRLRDVRGGDDARIDAMTGPLGVKLVGRSPLPARAADFLRAMLSARGTPLPKLLPSAPGADPSLSGFYADAFPLLMSLLRAVAAHLCLRGAATAVSELH